MKKPAIAILFTLAAAVSACSGNKAIADINEKLRVNANKVGFAFSGVADGIRELSLEPPHMLPEDVEGPKCYTAASISGSGLQFPEMDFSQNPFSVNFGIEQVKAKEENGVLVPADSGASYSPTVEAFRAKHIPLVVPENQIPYHGGHKHQIGCTADPAEAAATRDQLNNDAFDAYMVFIGNHMRQERLPLLATQQSLYPPKP